MVDLRPLRGRVYASTVVTVDSWALLACLSDEEHWIALFSSAEWITHLKSGVTVCIMLFKQPTILSRTN